ncbi:hypothetical protein L210DRAFT_3534605 [Boletus edulis BED1]|uniref:Uncharacterized protein n=1 Tax=Boletus edulis BED1 TaxID=1328754 RepID=A0AAD4GGR0_BOLED|nr:hypothetical protein L210DRAFT_3534605 [Boletus edulis BED1]
MLWIHVPRHFDGPHFSDQALSTISSNIMLALLTRQTRVEIKESNIAVLGRPEFEANHQAKVDMRDPIWEGIGEAGGAKMWRIEQSRLIDWPDQGRVSA